MQLEKVKIRKVIGPTPNGAAVLLGNDKKTFVVFVGFYEAAALIREINEETPARPLTHELIQSVFIGFDVEVKKVIISSIIENTFCATLILQQRLTNGEGEWAGKRNEVRIDARPSDCLVLALKTKSDIFVTEEVFQQVQDVSKMTSESENVVNGLNMGSLEFEFNPNLEGFPGALELGDSCETDELQEAFGFDPDVEEDDEGDEPVDPDPDENEPSRGP